MKLTAALVVATCWLGLSSARADDDEPKTDTAATRAGEAWMKAMLAPGGSVAAPSKERPLDFVVANGTRSCRALKTGTAKDFKLLAKLKTCAVDSHKAIGSSTTTQWFELPDGLGTVLGIFPAKYAKKIKAAARDATIVQGHYVGDGLNMDAYLALGADGKVKALWLTEEAFE